ncbi:putative sporulation protein YtxC [Bacillus sp. EB01]|uniref:putative sporulation protein YtxC n=1 Tax=Bacillus sp. EB01 TaxID=1347086 RepID=UPI0005C5C76C|nr:putative sporulation protein YtxC [Bacillus sp. EB01]
MAEINFRSNLDAKCFQQLLQKHIQKHKVYIEMQQHEERQHTKLLIHSPLGEYLHTLKDAFYEFIMIVKLDEWFRDIVRDTYFFRDQAEEQHITDIMYSILDGERQDLTVFIEQPFPGEQVRKSIDEIIGAEALLSFDSITKFRLRPVFEYLRELAAVAIDEYKMEQEYQVFIESLRAFLAGRPPKIDEIHLLAKDGVTFYDVNMQEVKKAELAKMIDRKLLINHPIYVDSVAIAPLLSLAPKKIVLYTEDQDEPLVRTLANIFEERVLLLGIKEFPLRRSN